MRAKAARRFWATAILRARSAGSTGQVRPAARWLRRRGSTSDRAVGGTVRRQHDPLAVLDQGGEGREQFFLGRGLAAHELDVVQQQHVGRAQAFLEGRRRAILHGAHEGRQEAFGGQIDHLGLRLEALGLPGDGVEQVGLAVAVGAAEEDRVEVPVGPARHLFGDGQGEGVALAFHEAVEGQAFLQAGGAHGAGAVGDGGHGRGGNGANSLGGRDNGVSGALNDGARRGRRADLGPATDFQTARQAVQAQPQLVHATQGVLAHPVAGIGGRGDEDQLAGAVGTNRRRRDIGAEGAFADFRAQTARRLRPDPIRVRHARHCQAPHR
jgi:hypothetical protein